MKRVFPLAILLAAFAIRLYLLADSNIWYDEGLAVWAARQTLPDIAAWTSADVHPPLYFWLLHFMRGAVGESEFAVRWLSVAFGTLAVAGTYTLTRTLLKKTELTKQILLVPLVAMLLLALSRFHVWWSQEARMYVLGSLLVVLSLYFTVKLRQRLTIFAIVGYLLSTIAALYTLYLLAFLLVIEGLYWLATLPRSREAWRSLVAWAMLQIGTLVVFAPWLWYAFPRMNQWSVQVPFDGGQFGRLYATLLTMGISTDIEQVAGLVLLLTGLIVAGVLVAWRIPTNRSGLGLLLLALLIPPLIVWMATTFPRAFGYSPKPEARYFVPYVPAFAIVGAWGIAALVGGIAKNIPFSFSTPPSRLPLLAIIGIGALLLGIPTGSLQAYYQSRLLTDDYHSITATMRSYWDEDGDVALLHSDQPWPVFTYYWTQPWDGVTYTQDVAPEGTLTEVYPLWERHEAVWLVLNEDAQRIDPQRQVETWLRSKAVAEQEWRFGTKRLILFMRTAERAEYAYLSPMQFVQWEQALSRVRPGMVVHFFYSDLWAEESTLVTLIMGSPAEPIASSTVETNAPGLQRLQFDLLIPANTPAATYPLYLQQGNRVEQISTLAVLSEHNSVFVGEATLPPTATPLNVTLGEPPLITLRGYEQSATTLTAGDDVGLTLYWEAEQPIILPYKGFVHLSAANETIWAQADSEPVNGTRPTTSWQVGELIADSHTLTLDPDTPPGRYTVWVGLYDPATGARLTPVQDENGNPQVADRIKVTEIEVER